MSDVRVLTVKQPWADLIMAGIKDVENRTWAVPKTLPCQEGGEPPNHTVADGYGLCSPFPFRLGIHAAKEPDRTEPWTAWKAWSDWWYEQGDDRPAELIFPERTGVLLGSVTVTDCHHADDCTYSPGDPLGNFQDPPCSQWAQPDVFHWTLADPEPLDDPIPMKGRLGLWTTELVNSR